MLLQKKRVYDFADFRLDLSEKVLLKNGKTVSLTPKVFETLQLLVENAGRLLEKDELIEKIWQGRFVEESNLTFNIKMLRKALSDSADKPRFIETVPRRGYRFIAEVKIISANDDSEKLPPPTVSSIPENIPAENPPKAKRFLIPFIAVLIVLIGTAAIGSWYLQNKNYEPNAPVLSAPFASEKLSTNGKVVHAVISPDGKNVVYTNGTGSDKESIWLRQLESNSNIEIIPPSDDLYAGITLSPDGNTLYFVRRSRLVEETAAIYRVSIFGGVPQKIIGETQGSMSISPDGTKISFVRCYYRKDEYCSLWIADADGKNERKLASRPSPIRIRGNKISPDGKSVAFAVGQSENAANEFSLLETDIETGTERELTKLKFFNINSLSWLPDKSGLLLTARINTDNNFRIWLVSKADGSSSPLTKDSESYSALSLDKEANRLVSSQVKPEFNLRLFSLENPQNKRIVTNARGVSLASNGKILISSPMSGNDEIWSLNADGSEQRQLTNEVAEDNSAVTAPDNNSIFFASNRSGAIHVWRMNSDGSNQTQITQKEGGFPLFVSPDGHWVYYHHGLDRTLWRVSTQNGEEQSVINKGKYAFAISPDGTKAAFPERQNDERLLTVVSLADGQTIKTFKLNDPKAHPLFIVWTSDRKSLAYITSDSVFQNKILWLQPLSEETPQQITAFGDEEITSLAAAPDDKTFAVTQGSWKHDAVLLKGLR